MRQMSYSLCRFWAYDESKKILGAGASFPFPSSDYVTPTCDAIACASRGFLPSSYDYIVLRPWDLHIHIL
jgi:hypothetical protein